MKLKAVTSVNEFVKNLLQAEAVNKTFDLSPGVEDLDWNEMYTLSERHGILPVIYRLLFSSIPPEQRPLFDKAMDVHNRKVSWIIEETQQVALLAKRHAVPLVCMKGVVLSKLIYGDLFSRITRDIDTLLNESDVPMFSKVLKEQGYIHANLSAKDYEELPFPILKQYDHHEFFEHYKKMNDGTHVELELQRYIHGSVKEQHIGEFLNHVQTVDVNGVEITTFDLEHTFIALCENVYENSEWSHTGPRLKDYFDLLSFVEKYKAEVSWQNIRNLGVAYGLSDILNVVMHHLDELFAGSVSPELLAWFDCQPATSINDHSRLVLNWEENITQRVFDPSENKWEQISQMLIGKSFSHENPNYANPVHPTRKEDINVGQFEADFMFTDLKYKFPIQYKVYTNNSQIGLFVRIERQLYEQFDRFQWDVSIFNADLTSRDYLVAKEDNSLMVTDLENQETYGASVLFQDDHVVVMELPLNCSCDRLTINVALTETIYKSIKHSLQYSSRSFWVNRLYICNQ